MSNRNQRYNNKTKIFKYLTALLSVVFLFITLSCSGNSIMYSLTLDGNGATEMNNYKEIYYNTTNGGWYSDVTGHNQIFNIDIPRRSYTVNFDVNDNEAHLADDRKTVNYTFVGYGEYIDEEGYINENITLSKNVTVSATWKQLEESDKIDLDEFIPTNTNPNKDFKGWGRSLKNDAVIDTTTQTRFYTPKSSNDILYAKWTDNSVYKLTLNQNEGTSGVGEFTTELYYSVTEKNGSHWFDRDPSDNAAVSMAKITIPKREYTISFNVNPENLPSLVNIQKPSNLTFKWDFQGYGQYIDSTGLIRTGASISKDTSVDATWTRQSRDLELKSVEAPGFRFQGWYDASDNTKTIVNTPYPGSENGIRKDVKKDVTLNAQWTNLVDRNTLTLNTNGATGVSGGGAANISYIYYNTNYNPVAGQDTSPWMDINDNELFSIPTPVREYTITYKKDNLNVDVEWAMPSGETPPSDDKDTFSYNFLGYWDRIETLEAGTLNENYIGRGTHYNEIDSTTNSVVYDGSGKAKLNLDTTSSSSARIDGNTEAIAVWGIDSTKKIKLPVCSAKGYNFVGWRTSGSIINHTDRTDAAGNPISSEFNAYYPKNSNVTLVAVWEPKTYTITLDGSTFTGLSSSLPYDAVYYTVGGTWTEDENKLNKLPTYITPLKKEIAVRFESGTLEGSTETVPNVNTQNLTSSYTFKGFDYKPTIADDVDDPAKELGVQIIDEKGNIKSTFTEKNSTTRYEIYYDGVATAIFSDTPSAIDLPTPKIPGYRLIGWKVVPVSSDAEEKTIYVVGDAKESKFTPESGYIRTVTSTVSGETTVTSTVTLRGVWEKIKYHVEIENDDTLTYLGSKDHPIVGTDKIKLNNGDGVDVKIKVIPYVYKRGNDSKPTAEIEEFSGNSGSFVTSISDTTLNTWFENFLGTSNSEFIPDSDGLKIAKRDTNYIVVRLKGILRSTLNVVRDVKLNIGVNDILNNRLTEDEFKNNVPSLYFKKGSTVVNTLIDKDLDNKDLTTVYNGTRYYPLAVKVGSQIGGTNGVLVKINIKNSDNSTSKDHPRPQFRSNLTSIDVKNWFAPLDELVGTGLEYAIVGEVGRKSEITIRITGKPSISRIGTVAISIPYTDLQGGYSESDGTVNTLTSLNVFYNTTDYFNKVFDVTVTAAEQNSTGYNWSDVHVIQKTIDQTMSFVALKGGIDWPVTWTRSSSPSITATIKEDFAVADIAVTGGFAKVVYDWAIKNGYTFYQAPTVFGYKDVEPKGARGSSVDPVTNFTWYDSVIFSNAATEWYNAVKGGNLTCAYTSDGTLTGTPLRDAKDAVTLNTINPNQNVIKTGAMSHVPGATGFRLPTRAEWQYLASVSPYPLTNAETKFNVYTGSVNLPSGFYAQSYDGASGDPTSTRSSLSSTLIDYAIYKKDNSFSRNIDYGTQAVGKYWTSRGYNDDTVRPRGAKPNLIGLYDVHGNTFEYVEDLYDNTKRYAVGGGYLNTNIVSSYCIGDFYNGSSQDVSIDDGRNGGLRLVRTL